MNDLKTDALADAVAVSSPQSSALSQEASNELLPESPRPTLLPPPNPHRLLHQQPQMKCCFCGNDETHGHGPYTACK